MTDLRQTAEALITAARSTDWSPTQQCVLNTFQAKWSASLPTHRVQRIAEALEDLPKGALVDNIQKVLTALVRRKVLRSRSIRGVTHYELNI